MEILKECIKGTRVIRGRDWCYGTQDWGLSGPTEGVVVGREGCGWVNVVWSNGKTFPYRVGIEGKYDLYVVTYPENHPEYQEDKSCTTENNSQSNKTEIILIDDVGIIQVDQNN